VEVTVAPGFRSWPAKRHCMSTRAAETRQRTAYWLRNSRGRPLPSGAQNASRTGTKTHGLRRRVPKLTAAQGFWDATALAPTGVC